MVIDALETATKFVIEIVPTANEYKSAPEDKPLYGIENVVADVVTSGIT